MVTITLLDTQQPMSDIRDRVASYIKATSDKGVRELLRDVLAVMDKPYSIEWVKDQYRLSPTEYRILCLLIEGNTASSIAEITGSQISTVRVHISRIYRRTNVSNFNELTSLLLQNARNA